MLKCLLLLLFVARGQASVINEARDLQRAIPTPIFTVTTVIDQPTLAFVKQWTPVPGSMSDPVFGYLFTVWEQIPFTNRYRLFQEIYIHGAEQSAVAVATLKTDLWYQHNVRAFTRSGRFGPPTSGDAIMILGGGGRLGESYITKQGEIMEDYMSLSKPGLPL